MRRSCRSNVWGLAVALSAGLAGLAFGELAFGGLALAGANADSPPRAAEDKPQSAATSFAPVCKAAQIADSRPDPAWVTASFANDHCRAPLQPAPLDGYTATRAQIVAGMAAARRYAIEADDYQQCISRFIAAPPPARAPLQTALLVIERHRIFVSEEDKKKVQSRIDGAVNAFNAYGSECTD